MVKNPLANAGDVCSVPEFGRSPGIGNGYPLQFSCLGNPMNRGAWQITVHGVTESDMREHSHGMDISASPRIWITFCFGLSFSIQIECKVSSRMHMLYFPYQS